MGSLVVLDFGPFMLKWLEDYRSIFAIMPISRILELSTGTEVFHLQDYMGEYPAYSEYCQRLEDLNLIQHMDVDWLTGFFAGFQEQLHLYIVAYIGVRAQYYFERWLSPTDAIIRVINS